MDLFSFKNHFNQIKISNSCVSKKVEKGDVFVKNDKVPSTFIVDRLLDFCPAPTHVRLKEVGGNERNVTVALATLLDERFWHKQEKTV